MKKSEIFEKASIVMFAVLTIALLSMFVIGPVVMPSPVIAIIWECVTGFSFCGIWICLAISEHYSEVERKRNGGW